MKKLGAVTTEKMEEPNNNFKKHTRFYCLSEIFPHNCSEEKLAEVLFADGMLNNDFETRIGWMGNVFDTLEEAIKDLDGNNSRNYFYRIYQVDSIENLETHKELCSGYRAVKGFAPNGSEINDTDWDYISSLFSDLFSLLDSETRREYLSFLQNRMIHCPKR